MVPAGRRLTLSTPAASQGDADQLGDSKMKKLSIATTAIFLGLCGIAMAGNDNQDSQQSYTNATGPNPFMTYGAADVRGSSAFASHPVQQHVVHRQVR
jgi:hypothetical protein